MSEKKKSLKISHVSDCIQDIYSNVEWFVSSYVRESLKISHVSDCIQDIYSNVEWLVNSYDREFENLTCFRLYSGYL